MSQGLIWVCSRSRLFTFHKTCGLALRAIRELLPCAFLALLTAACSAAAPQAATPDANATIGALNAEVTRLQATPSPASAATCSDEAHVLTFRPIVDAEDTRVLSEFAWRCPNGHTFATAMLDIPLPSWRYVPTR